LTNNVGFTANLQAGEVCTLQLLGKGFSISGTGGGECIGRVAELGQTLEGGIRADAHLGTFEAFDLAAEFRSSVGSTNNALGSGAEGVQRLTQAGELTTDGEAIQILNTSGIGKGSKCAGGAGTGASGSRTSGGGNAAQAGVRGNINKVGGALQA
jgi:hypothetical protein